MLRTDEQLRMPQPHGARGLEAVRPQRASLRLAPPAPDGRARAAATARVLGAWLVCLVALNVMLVTAPPGPLVRRLLAAGVASIVFLLAFQLQRHTDYFARMSGIARLVFQVRAVTTGLTLLAAIGYFLPQLGMSPRSAAVAALSVAVVSSLWSAVTLRLLGAKPTRRVLLVGDQEPINEFVGEFRADPHPEYELVGSLQAPGSGSATTGSDLPALGSLDDLETVLAAERIDTVVLSVSRNRLAVFARLSKLEHLQVTVQELTGFSEHVFGRVPLESINAAWFMYLVHPFYRPYSRAVKRIADVVAALLIGVLSLPILPIVALAVKLTSPGPVFYSQLRVGAGGRPFRIYKFRTMVEDAERNGVAWATPEDPRITRVGGIMRNTRIDEIPQLWNVIRGTMSFVGPRPERLEFVSELERQIPYYNRRHQLKPGLTGWAQVRAGYADSVDTAADKLAYELYYLKHRSLLFDVVVFMETIRVVLSRTGAR